MTKLIFLKSLAVIALTAVLGFSFAAPKAQHLCEGFLPPNSMYIPEGLYATGGITQEQFFSITDRLERLYTADITAKGDTLKINRMWGNGTVNASADKEGNVRVLNMYGGLARHPAIGVEGMALIACHEMGHHLGGAPKVPSWFGRVSWATNEGGADYFGTGKCLRRFFAEDDNIAIVKDLVIDPTAKAACEKSFQDPNEIAVCMRSSEAGQQVADLFQDLGAEKVRSQYNTPDPTNITKTYDGHPTTQCRLDTFFAGMLCAVKESEANSDKDYKVGACFTPRDQVGFRPRCWFAGK